MKAKLIFLMCLVMVIIMLFSQVSFSMAGGRRLSDPNLMEAGFNLKSGPPSTKPAPNKPTPTPFDPNAPPEGMVFVPAGEFQMGCDPNHNGGYACNYDELPLHAVYLNSFFIDKFEVTNADYEKCVKRGVCSAPIYDWSNWRESYYGNKDYDDYPVIFVNWHDANSYCNWVGKRLPTEAEWEKAARGLLPSAYPWGDAQPESWLANYDFVDTAPVGSFPLGVSPYGAHDMAGNVAELVLDNYLEDYYSYSPYDNPICTDYSQERPRRGGNFGAPDGYGLRTADRGWIHVLTGDWLTGFRCAMPAGD